MCGIFGEFDMEGYVDLPVCRARLDRLAHRGPDGSGVEVGDFRAGTYRLSHNDDAGSLSEPVSSYNYFLGHRRLAIIDLSESAAQPMETLDRRFAIMLNGEIYNHVELRRRLLECGAEFVTDHSDTEVLLLAYAQWGEQCLEELNGMFAFVVFDRLKRKLFFARDPIGEKTLYYRHSGSSFRFSSEAGAIVHGDAGAEIDLTALASYVCFGYVLHPRSIYTDVRKLLPGCCGTLDLGSNRLEVRRYWDLEPSDADGRRAQPERDWLGEVDRCLSESVRLRLRSDVPLGAFVSGGIDSALVAKKVRDSLGPETAFHLFGADFPGSRGGQRSYMHRVAQAYGHDMIDLMVGQEGPGDIREITDVMDEPFDGGSAVAAFQLFKEARGRCKVMLTGDGGDELFAGYDRYRRFQRVDAGLGMIGRVRPASAGISAMLSIYPGRLGKLRKYVAMSQHGAYLSSGADLGLLGMLREREPAEGELREDLERWERTIAAKGFGGVKLAQYIDLMTILPGRMLYKVDRFSMHHSIEARVPLLDPGLVRLAFAMPTELNIQDNGGKAVLKAMLKEDLGSDFVDRKKEGFGNPLDHWMSGAEMDSLKHELRVGQSAVYQYLDLTATTKLFPQCLTGQWKGKEKMLWRLIVLNKFLERHAERAGSTR